MLTNAANVAKQTAVGAGDGLIKSVTTKINAGAELSNNLPRDIEALRKYNNQLKAGIDPQTAFAKTMTTASKAAKNLAQNSQGLPVSVDAFKSSQLQAATATKASTAAMVAQSAASALAGGAISMGVTLAVNGLVMGLDYLSHAHERAVEAVDNANQAYAENETELNNASSSLAQVEERLNALNSIQNPSLADKEETAELERQREELTAQCVL